MRKRRTTLPRHSWSYYDKRNLYNRLCEAVRRRDIRRIEDFLSRGIGPDQPTIYTTPALVYAASRGYEEIVKLLLEYTANPSCCGDEGVTPLMVAASNGCPSIIKLLLEHMTNMEGFDWDKRTSLARALEANNEECAALLRQAGATE